MSGIAGKGRSFAATAIKAVRYFESFDVDNDPHNRPERGFCEGLPKLQH